MTNRIKLQNTIAACSVVLLLFIVGVLIKIYLDDSNENWKQKAVTGFFVKEKTTLQLSLK